MPTILREDGLRFIIYVDDHDPAHVHAFGDGETKIVIADESVLRIVRAPKSESRRAVAIVRKHWTYQQRCWDDLHG